MPSTCPACNNKTLISNLLSVQSVLLLKIGVVADHFSFIGPTEGLQVLSGDDKYTFRNNIPVNIQFFGQAYDNFFVCITSVFPNTVEKTHSWNALKLL